MAMAMPMPPGQNMPPSNGTTNMMMMMNMQMSFYWGRKATVLFSGWPNNNLGMYILALLFVFFLAMAAEVLSNQPPIKRGTNPLLGGLIQSSVHFFRIVFVYLLMLAVMSFNIGIFIAVVVGHTLGFLVARSRAIAVANGEDQRSSSVTLKI
ncbi:copper transporter 6-like [Vicia villosa]|uniref:copper transporter 6-like n=1 Tax=Vicia villosa TaxID=3911 RepID=UPI00273B91D8|nr:copper transporter 6-like [Vicia villosa]